VPQSAALGDVPCVPLGLTRGVLREVVSPGSRGMTARNAAGKVRPFGDLRGLKNGCRLVEQSQDPRALLQRANGSRSPQLSHHPGSAFSRRGDASRDMRGVQIWAAASRSLPSRLRFGVIARFGIGSEPALRVHGHAVASARNVRDRHGRSPRGSPIAREDCAVCLAESLHLPSRAVVVAPPRWMVWQHCLRSPSRRESGV
jgi:hypothetical protein